MSKFPNTKRFQNHKANQNFFVSKEKAKELEAQGYLKYLHRLARINTYVEIFYKLEQLEELMLKELYYNTALTGDELAMMDAYASLCQNRPLEAIDRLSAKEIDFYLRDDMKVSSFSYLPNELFDFLSIGEELKKLQQTEKKILPHLDIDSFGHFVDLSTSEQFELIEDILGEFFFSEFPDYGGKLVCEEIDHLEISFVTNGCDVVEHENQITQLIRFHLQESKIICRFIR